MNRPSSRHPEALPEPARLERLCRSLAMLDALLSPDWEFRYHSFNQRWDPALGQRMASMRDGEGDDWFLLFQADGSAFLKGFAHELAHGGPPAGMFEGLPDPLRACLTEPAFRMEDTTFCLWNAGDGWRRGTAPLGDGADPDGSLELLALLAGDPADYHRFATGYWERPVSLDAVRRIYDHEPLTEALVAELAVDLELADLEEDLAEIGYP